MEGGLLKKVIMESAGELASNVESHMEECSQEITDMLNHLNLLNKWSELLNNYNTDIILKEVVYDLLSSVYISTNGLYRNAYASLRSAVELGVGFVYFTDNNYDFLRWKENKFSLSWSLLKSPNGGVLEEQYFALFFSNFNSKKFIERIDNIYSECSEFTHGKFNYMQTVETSKIQFDKSKFIEWSKMYIEVIRVIIVILRVRFSELLGEMDEDMGDFMNEIFMNIEHRELKIYD